MLTSGGLTPVNMQRNCTRGQLKQLTKKATEVAHFVQMLPVREGHMARSADAARSPQRSITTLPVNSVRIRS